MAIVNGYATEAQIRAELGDDASTLSQSLIEKAVNATSRAVDDFTGRRFWQDGSTVARKYRPEFCYKANVDDISTTTGLIVETTTAAGWSSTTTWTIDTDFELAPENAAADGGAYAWNELVAVGGLWFPAGYRWTTLRVTAKWGWSAVPDPVTEATVLRAVALFKRKEAPFGVAGFGDFGAIRITRADPDVIDLLSPYQRAMVA